MASMTTSIRISDELSEKINELVRARKKKGDRSRACGRSAIMVELIESGLRRLNEENFWGER